LPIWQTPDMTKMDVTAALASLGSRIRELRRKQDLSLATISRSTGISVSTLSRLESGQRKATLELLLPIAAALRISLDELTGQVQGDPRVRRRSRTLGGKKIVNLTHESSALQVVQMTFPAVKTSPDPRAHPGYDWIYVLSGTLRMVLGDNDFTMGPGEAAEFDTTTPHWWGSADGKPVEVLSIFGPQGEKIHLRAKPSKTSR
jgi:transcriptional regulator with XRE-family HTH domain